MMAKYRVIMIILKVLEIIHDIIMQSNYYN